MLTYRAVVLDETIQGNLEIFYTSCAFDLPLGHPDKLTFQINAMRTGLGASGITVTAEQSADGRNWSSFATLVSNQPPGIYVASCEPAAPSVRLRVKLNVEA